MNKIDKSTRVGIDLAPAGMRARAPGTSVLVEAQARTLLEMDVPWTWVPVFSNTDNPLRDIAEPFRPLTGKHHKFSQYASFELGKLWEQAGCDLGFATAYFVPFSGPPVVANYFDANFFEDVDAWHRYKQLHKHLWTRMLFSHSVKKSESLFILSDYGRDRMVQLFPKTKNKWVVTKCGFTPPGPAPEKTPAWALEMKRPFFLYVGSFSDNKNQRTLLKAWNHIQSKYEDAPELVILGPGPVPYIRDVITPLHQGLPRPHEVTLPGFTPDEEVAWAFRNALGYLQPSIAEGFGMPVIEAMSCGLPVACSNTTSLPSTAGDAALLFNPLNDAEIASCAEKIWKDKTARTTLIAAGSERVKLFSWENNAKQVASAIHDVLTKKT